MTDLFSPDDDDWADFRDRNPEYLLRVAGNFIRDYLGWHLSPSRTETIRVYAPRQIPGVIPLPSRYVTAVSEVKISEEVLNPDDYWWHQGGWIDTNNYVFDVRPSHATVTFTHGYNEVPEQVKQVAYELVHINSEAPVGNVSQMSTPAGYRISLTQPTGFHLNSGQANLLANYRLHGLA